MNNKIKSTLETMEGKIMFSMVREFLEFFNLDCTLSVYEPESYLGKVYHYQERNSVAEQLGLGSIEDGDSHVPLLLMLIRFVQLKKNDSNLQETLSVSQGDKEGLVDDIKYPVRNLNMTFELSNPTINLSLSKNESSPSHIIPDSDKSGDNTHKSDNSDKLDDPEITSQPILKECRNGDKPKLEKNKSKNTLPDISPLQNNKSRVSDILPSLYNKEYKDKSGLRELDKMFDMEAEYEEDFMYSSDLSLKCDYLNSDSNNISSSNAKNIKTDSSGSVSNEEFSTNSNKSINLKDQSNSTHD